MYSLPLVPYLKLRFGRLWLKSADIPSCSWSPINCHLAWMVAYHAAASRDTIWSHTTKSIHHQRLSPNILKQFQSTFSCSRYFPTIFLLWPNNDSTIDSSPIPFRGCTLQCRRLKIQTLDSVDFAIKLHYDRSILAHSKFQNLEFAAFDVWIALCRAAFGKKEWGTAKNAHFWIHLPVKLNSCRIIFDTFFVCLKNVK